MRISGAVARLSVWWDAVGWWLFRRSLNRGAIIGDRAYYTWCWNDPKGDDPPVMMLEIDDLKLPRKYFAMMSPAQAAAHCRLGLGAIEQQQVKFGDVEPREYDTRKAW